MDEKIAKAGLTTPHATVLVAVCSAISAVIGGWIGGRTSVTAAEIERISEQVVEEMKYKCSIKVEKFDLE